MTEESLAASKLADGEDRWQPARLVPTSGIKGVDEQEKRATSALLSVMMAVPEFSRSLLSKAGAPAGAVRTYIEPEFVRDGENKIRPDGAIVVRRGSNTWKALVEVKTGTSDLSREQIESYLDVARDRGFDVVITISNQVTGATEDHPLHVDRRKTARVKLVHWSWVGVLTEAVMQREHRGVSDPDQAWILGELIAYLKHPQSGAMQFQDMGPYWVAVRDAAREGALRPQDPGVAEVVVKWDQFIQYLCLHLAADLGVEVRQVLSRAEMTTPAERKQNLIKDLVQQKSVAATIRVRNAVGPITLTASLAARTITASVAVDAPEDGRPTTRVNWLVRQLRDVSDQARVSSAFAGVRETNSVRLVELRENPGALLISDKTRNPRTFTVSITREMGTKRGGVTGSFIGETTNLLLSFYREVVQGLKPWSSAAPKLPARRDRSDIAEQPANVVDQTADLEAASQVEEDPEPVSTPAIGVADSQPPSESLDSVTSDALVSSS